MVHEVIQRVFTVSPRWISKPWIGARGNRDLLPVLFQELNFTTGVEIGTQRGLYSKVLCEKNPGSHLTCIDPWSDPRQAYQKRHNRLYDEAVERLKPYNVTIIRKASAEAAPTFPDKSLDFVYIDGDHTFDAVMMDILLWVKKVKQGGIIACHDYANFYEVGVTQAVDAYTFCNCIHPKYVTGEDKPTAFWVNI